MISVVQTNLDIAITRLNNDFNQYIAEHDPTLVSGNEEISPTLSKRNTVQLGQPSQQFTLEHYQPEKRASDRVGQREPETVMMIEETKNDG